MGHRCLGYRQNIYTITLQHLLGNHATVWEVIVGLHVETPALDTMLYLFLKIPNWANSNPWIVVAKDTDKTYVQLLYNTCWVTMPQFGK